MIKDENLPRKQISLVRIWACSTKLLFARFLKYYKLISEVQDYFLRRLGVLL